MLRQYVMKQESAINSDADVDPTKFRQRGTDVSRLEGFSDGVFGFAMTLLVVSLDVPQTFDELSEDLRGFVAFGLCFALLITVWRIHYQYFRRYGLKDATTFALNSILLFVVLFFVYPLKFLFTVVVNGLLGLPQTARLDSGAIVPMVLPNQTRDLIIVYSLGYMAVFGVFALMFVNAYRQREALQLNALELFETRLSIQIEVVNIAVGLLAIVVALLLGPSDPGNAGWIFLLLWPLRTIQEIIAARQRRVLLSSLDIQ
jgi:uncharacterized membrane protein